MKWIQNPSVSGDPGKHYVTDDKAALYTSTDRPVGTRWTETTAPAGPIDIIDYDLITRAELDDALAALEVGGVPNATTSVKGIARILEGSADAPTVPWGSVTAKPTFYTAEDARDTLAAALVAGTNVTISPNDGSDTITIAASGGTTYTDEQARDAIAAALVAGTNITITPNDAGDTITVSVSGLSKSSVGLDNVDNTSDAAKPVSTATQTAIDVYKGAALFRSVTQHGGVPDCTQPSATITLTNGSTAATLSGAVAGLAVGHTIVTASNGRYTVTAKSGTSVTLGSAAAGSVTNTKFIYGTDNTAAFNALFAACLTTPQVAVIPNGRWLITGTIGIPEPGPNAQQVSGGLTVLCGGGGTGNTMRLTYQPATMFAGSALVWGGNTGGTMMQFSRMLFTNFIGGLVFVGQSTYDVSSTVTPFGPRPAIGFHLSQAGTPWAGTGYLTAGDWTFSDMDEGIRFGTSFTDNNCDTSVINRLYFERITAAGIRICNEQGLSYRFNWIHAVSCTGAAVWCEGGGAVEIGSLHLSACGSANPADPINDYYALDLASGYSGYAFLVGLLRIETGTVRVAALRNGWTHLQIGMFEEATAPSTDRTLFLVNGGILQIDGGHLVSTYGSVEPPFYLLADGQSKQPRVSLREMLIPTPSQWHTLFKIAPSAIADISVAGTRKNDGYGVLPDRHSRFERGPVVLGAATTDAATATRLDPMHGLGGTAYVYSYGPRIPQGTSVVEMVLIGDRGTAAPSRFVRRYTLHRASNGTCTLVSTETVGTDLVQGTDQLLALTLDSTYALPILRVQGTASTTVNWRARFELRDSYVGPAVVDY